MFCAKILRHFDKSLHLGYIAIALVTIYKVYNRQPSGRYETGGAACILALVIMIPANCNLVLFTINDVIE